MLASFIVNNSIISIPILKQQKYNQFSLLPKLLCISFNCTTILINLSPTGRRNVFSTNLNDKTICTHFMPYIEASAHPSIKDQEEMANSLIGFIEENISACFAFIDLISVERCCAECGTTCVTTIAGRTTSISLSNSRG